MLMRGSFIVPDMTEQGLVQVPKNCYKFCCCCVFVVHKIVTHIVVVVDVCSQQTFLFVCFFLHTEF